MSNKYYVHYSTFCSKYQHYNLLIWLHLIYSKVLDHNCINFLYLTGSSEAS